MFINFIYFLWFVYEYLESIQVKNSNNIVGGNVRLQKFNKSCLEPNIHLFIKHFFNKFSVIVIVIVAKLVLINYNTFT